MAIGAIVAIFGSYRVALLERRVQEAERLGQYRLKRFLGAGGMGDVYLAEHVLLKQPFAVKLLRPERIADERVLKRFEAEVHAMAKLQHWNTVEIYDYGHAPDGSIYDVAKLLDFGLVKSVENSDARLTMEGTIAGTPAYMSPEQAAGSVTVHARSDIYSLGAVGYFLLTGRPPFANRTSTQMIAAHIYEIPAPVSEHAPDVDPRLEVVVMRCMSKKLADRFPNVESMMAALRECPSASTWGQPDAMAWWRGRDMSVLAEA
jgi:serine/threonine protein kinase